MPLSEQEQRLLDEMERHLLQNDADVVSATRRGRGFSYRNLVIGALLILLGLTAIIVGIAVWKSVLVVGIIAGVLGFVAMVVGVILAMSPGSTGSINPEQVIGKPNGKRPSTSRFMDRMSDRWDRRQQHD